MVYISWSEAIKLCYELAEKILNSNEEFDSLVAVSRGGLIPARIVSDALNLDKVYVIRSRFWGVGGTIADKPLIEVHEKIDVKGDRVLVIDEVVDTGLTLKSICKLIERIGASRIKTGVLHYKSRSLFKPDYYVEYVREWVWIFYPWSLSETLYSLALARRDGRGFNEAVKEVLKSFGVEVPFSDFKVLLKSLERYYGSEKKTVKREREELVRG